MAVTNKFQGKFNIARNLLVSVLNIYRKYQINVITAGTDSDNLPAVINYINEGFRPILFWSTYRYYYNNNNLKKHKKIRKIKVLEKKKIKSACLKNSSRPVSFLLDRHFDGSIKRKIYSCIQKKILTDLKKEKLQIFESEFNKNNTALFTVIKEKSVSEILGRDMYRINDIILSGEETELNKKLLNSLLEYLTQKYEDISIIETFVKSNDWPLIEALIGSGLISVHNAVPMHKFL